MTREKLSEFIDLYRESESIILRLYLEFGIDLYSSNKPNIYNNFNLLIHELLVEICGDENTDLLEEYIFQQTTVPFDDLCKKLNI